MSLFPLQGHVAIVTGGSSGIGLACVELLLESGAGVAFCGRDPERLRSAEASLRQRFPQARLLAHACNVLDAESVNAFAAASLAALGPAGILINNAGQGRVSTFADTTDSAWTEELNLKFFSVINPVHAFKRQLESQVDAAIVCVNSLLASQPEPHMVATSAARAGVMNLVRSMATEFAPPGHPRQRHPDWPGGIRAMASTFRGARRAPPRLGAMDRPAGTTQTHSLGAPGPAD